MTIKTLFSLVLLFPVLAFAQEIHMSVPEAIALFDQHEEMMNKVEVGERVHDESYEMKGECVLYESTISTVLEVQGERALVLKEHKTHDKCQDIKTERKFLSYTDVNLSVVQNKMAKFFKKGFKASLKWDIVTFEKKEGGIRHTYQYQLDRPLFRNWVHYHNSKGAGVEDHNIKNALSPQIIPLSDVEGLPFCELEDFTQKILSCNE